MHIYLRKSISLAIDLILVHNPTVVIGRVAHVEVLSAETRLKVSSGYHQSSSTMESGAQSGHDSIVNTIVTAPNRKRSTIAAEKV